jgi:hypothetical protein
LARRASKRETRHAAAAAAARLANAPEELKAISASLERQFLATGNALEPLTRKGDEFVQLSESLLNSATGRVDGAALFYDAMNVVEKPLNFLGASHAQTCGILERLKRDNDRINEFINFQTELERTTAPLKYIQTLFKIESAPFGQEVQGMFGALTAEIEMLRGQLWELFTTKFDELRGIQRSVGQVIFELESQTAGIGETIAREQAQIQNSLRDLERHLQENQNRVPAITRISKTVSENLQEVVGGLQYQDIVHQKLEHTGSALTEMAGHLAADGDPQFVHAGCRLEAEQIEAVRRDLQGAEKSVTTGVQNILGQLVNADESCLTLSEFKQLTTSADGMVQVLFDVLETLRAKLAVTVASSSRAYEQLRPISGLASDLTAVVRDFSQRIHLIGLNAQVQAAQVREGAGLQMLSAHTSAISSATNQISEDIAGKLDQLVAGLAEGVRALEQQHHQALQQKDTLDREGGRIEHELHATRDLALSTLTQIDSRLQEIRADSQALTETVQYVVLADAPLAALAEELRSLAETLGRANGSADQDSRIHQWRNGYTMKSERQVFASVVKLDEPETAADVEDVELFDSVSHEAGQPAPSAEPFRAPVAPQIAVTSSTPANDSANNIEMF